MAKGTGSSKSRERNQNMVDRVNANANGEGNILTKTDNDYNKCIDAGGKWKNGKCIFSKKKSQAPPPQEKPGPHNDPNK